MGQKRCGAKGFKIWILEKFQGLRDTTPEEFTEDVMEMSATGPGPDDEEGDEAEAVPGNKRTPDRLAGGFRLLETASDFFYDTDPSMIRALTTANCGKRGALWEHFQRNKNAKCQAEVTVCLVT